MVHGLARARHDLATTERERLRSGQGDTVLPHGHTRGYGGGERQGKMIFAGKSCKEKTRWNEPWGGAGPTLPMGKSLKLPL